MDSGVDPPICARVIAFILATEQILSDEAVKLILEREEARHRLFEK